jgi:hypothetical protein
MSWCDEKSASPAIMPLQVEVYKKTKSAQEKAETATFLDTSIQIFFKIQVSLGREVVKACLFTVGSQIFSIVGGRRRITFQTMGPGLSFIRYS